MLQARVFLLTRQRLALLLLRLPLAVNVQGAAPAAGQPETLQLLPALTPGRVSHSLQTHKTTGSNMSRVRRRASSPQQKILHNKAGEIDTACNKS